MCHWPSKAQEHMIIVAHWTNFTRLGSKFSYSSNIGCNESSEKQGKSSHLSVSSNSRNRRTEEKKNVGVTRLISYCIKEEISSFRVQICYQDFKNVQGWTQQMLLHGSILSVIWCPRGNHIFDSIAEWSAPYPQMSHRFIIITSK